MPDLTPVILTFDTSILAGSIAASSAAVYTRDFCTMFSIQVIKLL